MNFNYSTAKIFRLCLNLEISLKLMYSNKNVHLSVIYCKTRASLNGAMYGHPIPITKEIEKIWVGEDFAPLTLSTTSCACNTLWTVVDFVARWKLNCHYWKPNFLGLKEIETEQYLTTKSTNYAYNDSFSWFPPHLTFDLGNDLQITTGYFHSLYFSLLVISISLRYYVH